MINIKEPYISSVTTFVDRLSLIPKKWDGKTCILELKQADYNWQQMEWIGWYFEYKSQEFLHGYASFPGARYGNVSFDLRNKINWDLKTTVSTNRFVILNDKDAMDQSLSDEGHHGEIIAKFDVDFDLDRSFQEWHSELKGGKSKYEIEREHRTATSRRRKKAATLSSIIFLIIGENEVRHLRIMNQGRNSNGSFRKTKYLLDLRALNQFEQHFELNF